MAEMDTSLRRRKKWPEALKREIVSATLQPGASVSVVARQYDVNANQVFSWRRRYCIAPTPPPAPVLVPVTISPAPDVERNASSPEPALTEAIEIEMPDGCRVRVGSDFDSRALKRVLDVLRKR